MLVLVVFALAIGAAGCGGGADHTASKHRAKPTVLTHASLAFGAFHRFIWLPAHAGKFSDPVNQAVAPGRAAARFAASEFKVEAHQVQHSKRLQVLFAPLEVTADKIEALGAALSNHPSLARIDAIKSIMRRIATIAKANGGRIVGASATEIAAAGGPSA